MYLYNVSTTKVFVGYKTVLYPTKTFTVETLYNYNLLCYVKCSTSLLPFKVVAMSLYHIVNNHNCLPYRALALERARPAP